MATFTDAQTDAINAQGGSVLVSAAAGSGKTTVLIERIIRMITRRENPIRGKIGSTFHSFVTDDLLFFLLFAFGCLL